MGKGKQIGYLLEGHSKPRPRRQWLRAATALVLLGIGVSALSRACFEGSSWKLNMTGEQHVLDGTTPGKIASNAAPFSNFEQCSIASFRETGFSFLETATPITVEDFEDRRGRLAKALVAEGVDAFVVEPGYTFKYYANVSQPEWEVWEVWTLMPLCLFASR